MRNVSIVLIVGFSAASGWAAVDTGQVFAPRVDDTAIFYWHDGALLRRLK